jgi:4-alpha-glucanotransferase
MRQTGMLRLDHVMSLHRLYWIPQGHSAKEGAYVTYPAEELYAILSLESHRHKTALVGENLGTVPKEVNDAMARHGLRQMYVIQFAQRANPSTALAKPPPRSVASLNTHDMPTFAAHWRGFDIDDRADLGLFTKTEARKEHARRAELNRALAKFLQRKGLITGEIRDRAGSIRPAKILKACLRWLRANPVELVLVNLEDLWEEEDPQNVPGTSIERPNWRRKARLSVEEILGNVECRDVLSSLRSSAYTK